VRGLTAGMHDQLRLDPTPLQLNGNREADGVLEALRRARRSVSTGP
jgi:hypothetical protein